MKCVCVQIKWHRKKTGNHNSNIFLGWYNRLDFFKWSLKFKFVYNEYNCNSIFVSMLQNTKKLKEM